MQDKHRLKWLPAAFFMLLISLAGLLILVLQLKEHPTAAPDNPKNMPKYLSSIPSWDYEKLNAVVDTLHDHLQKSHPEIMAWLEKNANKHANFQYILATLEANNYWSDDPRRDNDRITHRLQAAAAQGHASALYRLGRRAWYDNLEDKAFDYLIRAFYAGYYFALRDLHIFSGKTHQKQIKAMEHYAKNLTEGDFEQFYQPIDFYLLDLEDIETAVHYFEQAKKR